MEKTYKTDRNEQVKDQENKFWIGLLAGLGIGSLLKITRSQKNCTFNLNFENNPPKIEKQSDKHILSKEKFWFGLSIILFIFASSIAYQLIWVSQATLIDHVTLSPIQSVGADYMGLRPPLKDYLWQLNPTDEIRPEIFKDYIAGNRTSYPAMLPSKVDCIPDNGEYLFVEQKKVKCDIRGFRNLPFLNDTIASSKNKTTGVIIFTVQSVPMFNLSICSISKPEDCSTFNMGHIGYDYISVLAPKSSMYRLRLSILWNNYSGYESEPAIEYVDSDSSGFNIHSTEEALEVYQRNKDRGYQLIIAIFALFGIFPAVYYLRKLWENKE